MMGNFWWYVVIGGLVILFATQLETLWGVF